MFQCKIISATRTCSVRGAEFLVAKKYSSIVQTSEKVNVQYVPYVRDFLQQFFVLRTAKKLENGLF